MSPAEAAVLLAGIAVFDNRKPGSPEEAERTATLWAQALHDVPLADAGRAVTEHFATSSEYLMPAHIRAAVKRIRNKRIADHPPLTPPPGLSDVEELAWLGAARRRIGNGEVIDCDAAYGELVTAPEQFRELMPAAIKEDDA
jgi:hypothetical protein